MADQFISLLDITARRNTDQAVGLVEEVVTYAPEIEKVMRTSGVATKGEVDELKAQIAELKAMLSSQAGGAAANDEVAPPSYPDE